VPPPATVEEPDELAEAVAEQLLARWGVLFRDLALRERLAVPWRQIQWALRRLEARGVIRGGRFVHGFSGEQYATPEAVDLLRQVRRAPDDGETVTLAAGDPLNLSGVILSGGRIPAVSNRTINWRDGLPVEHLPTVGHPTADGAIDDTDAGHPTAEAAFDDAVRP
jgi:ATP-dependent Lhr-like helicase